MSQLAGWSRWTTRWTRGAAALALAAVAGLAASALWGGIGSAQSYTPAYYPVPVIEAAAGENNAFYLKIMRCAKTREACSSSELTQAAEYRAVFDVEISGAAGGLIWADHATRPSWSGSLCDNQSGRTPARTCTTDHLDMLQANDVADNRPATAAVAAELFRFAPPPGRSSMTITVKLSGGVLWANRVYQLDSNGDVVSSREPPYYPLINEALTTATRTLSFTESMAEASLLRDASETWDFVRVNGESRYWARDAIYFKIGVSDDYMVHQASKITVSGPAGSFIKPAPGPAEDADCTARTTEAAMNSCELTPVAQAASPLRHLTLRPSSRTKQRERLMLFSPPASGSGTATITVRTERPHGTSSPAGDTASIQIRYAETVPPNLPYAYPVPKLLSKLSQDLTPAEQAAERKKYAERMNLGSYGNPLVRWEREPFSNAQLIPGDSLLTAFVGIDARDGEELELVSAGGESPEESTGVFDSYLPWWGDDTTAPGDAGLCAVGPTNQYAYAPCRDSNTLGVLRTTLLPASTMAQVIARQTAETGGAVKWSIPQQTGTGWEMPASVPASPGRTTTFGLKEMRSPGDGSGVKLVTRATTGTVTLSATRQGAGGSADDSLGFHWKFDEERTNFNNDGDTIKVAAGPKATLTVPAGRQLEAACIHRLTSLTSLSDKLLRVYSGVNVIERGMYDFAHGVGHYDLGYYERFYTFTASTRPSHTDRSTGTRPKHPFCTEWTIEGRYDVMRHQRYLAVANTTEITAAALAAGSAGTSASLALPAWGTGSRHIFVAVPASVGDVASLDLGGGQTLDASDPSDLERLRPDLEINGITYKVWYSVGTVPQSASGSTVGIVQQSPSVLVVEGPAYWRTDEAADDPSNPSKKSQVLPIGYGTPYELLTCEQPGKQGGDVLCKVVDLKLEPPQLVLDTSQSESGTITVLGRLHGIRGRSLEVAWGLAGSNWQGRTATAGAPGIQNLHLLTDPGQPGEPGGPAGPGGSGGTGAVTLFGPAQGSASAISLAASLPDDADQVLQETDDRALRIGPTATVTAPSGKDVTIGCIQTFGSSSPATVTWMRTGAGPGEAPPCAYDDLLDGRESYLVITGPARWTDGNKRLSIGTNTGFPVLQCDEVADEDADGDWLVGCAIKSADGKYPRFTVDAGAETGSTIKITASFEQAGTAPDRKGWRVSWREGTGRSPNTRWTSHPPEADRGTEIFGSASFPVREIKGVGSVVLKRFDPFLDLVLADSDEKLRLAVLNGEGNTAEQEDVSAITVRTTAGTLRSDWCPQHAGCTLDMAALRTEVLADPALFGDIPLTLHTPAEAGRLTATATVVSTQGEALTSTLEIGIRGPAENLDAGDVGDRDLLRRLALAGRLPLVHYHATPEDDDRDIAHFPLHAFDALVQDAIFPTVTTSRILNSAGEVQSDGFVVTEQCPLPDPRISRLSCRMVVQVVAPVSDPLTRGRYRLEIGAGGNLQDYADFLVVGGPATIEVVSASTGGMGPGDRFDFEVLVLDDEGMPVADGTSVWWEARTRNAPLDQGGTRLPVAVLALQPLIEERTPTKAGRASGEMLIAGREIGILYARAGGTRANPDVAILHVIDTGLRAACRGDNAFGPSSPGADGGLHVSWTGPDGCRASEIRSLLDGAGRTIALWSGVEWITYSERDGERLPGSRDFIVRRGSLLWLSSGPPGE